MKKILLLLLLMMVPLLVVFGCGKEGPGARPRNVLLLTLDTTRADHLGCYGYRQNTSPNLDALARRGLRFDNAIAAVPLTRPSHATIMTGLLPQRHGVWSNGPYRLEPQMTTLAELLTGFQTGAVVSSYVLAGSFGFSQGFQYFEDHLTETPGKDPERPADGTAADAIGWINRLSDSPFFLWVHFYDPHDPYEPPEPYASRFPSKYDGEIAFMDHAIGDVLAALQSRKLLDRTLVIAAGDHGEGLGDHGESTHGYYLYDSTMRVPLIMAGPGVPPGKILQNVVSLTDITPTILEAVGRPKPAITDGRSLWKSVTASGEPAALPAVIENRSLHFQFGWAALSGIRTEKWKWIDAPAPELYDMGKDPGESTNVAAGEQATASQLRKQWKKQIPPDAAPTTQRLTPEEEEKLASLGYISASSGGSNPAVGPDPKQFASIVSSIETLIRERQRDCVSGCDTDVQKILAADPGNLFALRVEGELLLRRQKFPEALQVLTRLRDAYENHPETLALLAQAYEKTGDVEKALAYYRKATSPPWIYWPAVESVARLSLRLPGRIERAQLLNQLNELTPGSYREVISVARAFAILSEFAQAEARFRKALDYNAAGAEALVGIAQMMERTGRNREAVDWAARVQPPTTESLFVLATAQSASGDKQAACENFVQVSGRNPTNSNLLSGLGFFLEQCGRPDLAAQSYESALRGDPQNPQALYNLARLMEIRGNAAAAKDLYRRFLQVAPPSLATQRELAEKKAR